MNRSTMLFISVRIFWLLMFIGICLLPGPRSLIDRGLGILLSPTGIASTQAGLHLSAYPYCWLFGLEQQPVPYPAGVDSFVAGIAFLVSVTLQVFIVINLYLVYLRLLCYRDVIANNIPADIDASPTPLHAWQEDEERAQRPVKNRSA